ncbi:MAG: type II secretion system protein GspN [Polyangiales bacterium]
MSAAEGLGGWRQSWQRHGKEVLVYAGLFVLATLVFFYLLFPYDRLRETLVRTIEEPPVQGGGRRSSGWKAEIAELSPAWLTGVELSAVQLTRSAKGADKHPIIVQADSVYVRLQILPLLVGDIAVSFAAEMAGGSIEGEYRQGDGEDDLEIEIQDVALQRQPAIRTALGLPVGGRLQGRLALHMPENLNESTGDGQLQIQGLQVGNGKAKLKGLTIERVDAGNLDATLSVRDGGVQLEGLSARGPDLVLQGKGQLRLLRPLKLSNLDLQVRFKFTNAYRNRSESTKEIFLFMDALPALQAAHTDDGFLQYKIQGALGAKMRAIPAGKEPVR